MKSHFFAEQAILACFVRKTRVVCIREVQVSIKDSVKQLLVDKIQKLGLGYAFEVLDTEIRGPRGSLIVFRGMQSYNAENIKSLEDFDIAWVEEAQTLSDKSLRLLRPTIRKPGSQLWFSWNPRYDTDAVDKFFRGQKPPADAIIINVNWYDNPWFPEVLLAEKNADYDNDPEVAEHVWGGGYETVTEASYYGRMVAKIEKEGRVGHFPHNPLLPVVTGWDLGIDDYTAVWFGQIIGGDRLRIIDYYEAQNFGADEILAEALPEYTQSDAARIAALLEAGRARPFTYQRHFFPHDIGVREWGAGGRTRIDSLIQLGMRAATIHRGVAANPEDRVQAVRRLLPVTEFNQTSRVMLGLSRLRRYRRKMNEQLGTYIGPLKDGNDHGADAFGELAINCGIRALPKAQHKAPVVPHGSILIDPPERVQKHRTVV